MFNSRPYRHRDSRVYTPGRRVCKRWWRSELWSKKFKVPRGIIFSHDSHTTSRGRDASFSSSKKKAYITSMKIRKSFSWVVYSDVRNNSREHKVRVVIFPSRFHKTRCKSFDYQQTWHEHNIILPRFIIILSVWKSVSTCVCEYSQFLTSVQLSRISDEKSSWYVYQMHIAVLYSFHSRRWTQQQRATQLLYYMRETLCKAGDGRLGAC